MLNPFRPILLLALAAWACFTAANASDTNPAGSPQVRAAREALSDVLASFSRQSAAPLTCSRELAPQPLTVSWRDAGADQFARGLKELLSAGPEAPVLWQPVGEGGRRLVNSAKRRLLAESLQTEDLRALAREFDRRREWALRDAQAEIAAAQNPLARMARRERLASAMVLEYLGEAGRAALLSGQPVSLAVRDCPEPLKSTLVETLTPVEVPLPPGVQVPAERNSRTEDYLLILSPYRRPGDAGGAGITKAIVRAPDESVATRAGGYIDVPRTFPRPSQDTTMEIPPADSRRAGLRIRVTLNPDPDARPGERALVSLDDLLLQTAEAAGMRLLADGYLQPPALLPRNLTLTDYPLEQLLDHFCFVWSSEWRCLEGDPKTLLVRARNWWMEDQVHVPEPIRAELHRDLPADRTPSLEALCRLAELAPGQVRRLLEAGLVPGARDVEIGFCEMSGPQMCLRFLGRLPAPLRQKALGVPGLPLREAPPDLVQGVLASTLVAWVGVVRPEQQAALVFQVRPHTAAPGEPTAWRIRIYDPAGTRRRWQRDIRARPPRPLR